MCIKSSGGAWGGLKKDKRQKPKNKRKKTKDKRRKIRQIGTFNEFKMGLLKEPHFFK
jgi:hypothetical protein